MRALCIACVLWLVGCDTVAERPSGPLNVDGQPLVSCSTAPMTGYFRDGSCRTGAEDRGIHTVCAQVTEDFLDYTRQQGNDLVTPRGSFPGLQAGDSWCLCAARWDEARQAGHAPQVRLGATHQAALSIVEAQVLRDHAAE